MNRKTMMISAAAIFTASVLMPLAWAQNPGENNDKGKVKEEARGKDKGPGDRLAAELNLTGQQRDKLQAIRQGRHEKMQQLREAIHKARQALREALKNPSAKRANIEPLANQLKTLRGQLFDARIDHILTLKEILTPEQFAKMQSMMKEKMQNHKGGRGGWGQGKEGPGGMKPQGGGKKSKDAPADQSANNPSRAGNGPGEDEGL